MKRAEHKTHVAELRREHKTLEDKLHDPHFLRVHRSFIVNLNHIESIEDNFIILLNKQIPIGKTYKEQLMSRLDIL